MKTSRTEDDGPATRDADKIEAVFDSEHSESAGYAESKAYLSCVCQLAKEGCPSQETLEGLSKLYQMAFSKWVVVPRVYCLLYVLPRRSYL